MRAVRVSTPNQAPSRRICALASVCVCVCLCMVTLSVCLHVSNGFQLFYTEMFCFWGFCGGISDYPYCPTGPQP